MFKKKTTDGYKNNKTSIILPYQTINQHQTIVTSMQGGSLRLPQTKYDPVYTRPVPNTVSRYGNGITLFSDAHPIRAPTPTNHFEPAKYSLKPYTPVYGRTPINQTTISSNKSTTTSSNKQNPLQHAPQPKKSSTKKEAKTAKKPLVIKVKKSKNLMTAPNNLLQVYPTSSKKRGFLFIINNMQRIPNKNYQTGAKIDQKNLIKLFKQMSFKIDKHTNKKGNQMQKLITKYRKKSCLKKYDMSIVIIMGSGMDSGGVSLDIRGTDDVTVPTSWIIDEFNESNCPGLSGKPKIFIFLSCRKIVEEVHKDAVQEKPREYSDMLIAYCTLTDASCYGNPKSGSYYVEILCKVFMEHACDVDFENLLKLVNCELKKTNMEGSRQISNFENRGFNKICFINPGKKK